MESIIVAVVLGILEKWLNRGGGSQERAKKRRKERRAKEIQQELDSAVAGDRVNLRIR